MFEAVSSISHSRIALEHISFNNLKVEGMSIIFYMYCVANFYDQLKYQSMLHKKIKRKQIFF